MWEHLEKPLERRATAKVTGRRTDDCSSGPAWSGLQCARGGPGQSAVVQVANLDHGAAVVPGGGGGEAPRGVVDLTLDLHVAKQRQNYEAPPEAPAPPPNGGPAPSGTSRYSSTRLRSEPVGYPYASARLMCSTDGLALVRVTGEIDLCTAPQLLVAVNKALGNGARSIYIDLAQVSFFGAAGATALLVARRHCQRRGAEFMLLRPSRPALRVLALTDLVRPVIDLRGVTPTR
jgi:anti-anti-sigma factor